MLLEPFQDLIILTAVDPPTPVVGFEDVRHDAGTVGTGRVRRVCEDQPPMMVQITRVMATVLFINFAEIFQPACLLAA